MINCIIVQTFSSWELIIVDDVSTDDSVKMVSTFIQKDNRIKLLIRNREPKGAQTCRNIGFENSRGKYVVFFDSDDLISPCCLQQRVEFMELNPSIDFGIFPAATFSNEKESEIFNISDIAYGKKRKSDVLSDFLKADYPFTMWTNIYKKESILDLNWDEKIKVLTDFDFIATSLIENKKFDFCETAIIDYFYRTQNINSLSKTFITPDKCASTIYLFSRTLDSLRKKNDYKKHKEDFLHFIVLHLERLVMDNDSSKIDDYLSFCKSYYS